MEVQNYLQSLGEGTTLDPNNKVAAEVFVGAIDYAARIFSSHLILGGAHSVNKDDKLRILDALKSIQNILNKYQPQQA